jgi:hypothetical protein
MYFYKIFVLLFLTNAALALDDFAQGVQGARTEDNFDNSALKEETALQGSRTEDNFPKKLKGKEANLPFTNTQATFDEKQSLKQGHLFSGGNIPGVTDISSFSEENIVEKKKSIRNSSLNDFTFTYLKDDFEYVDSQGIYNNTYKGPASSQQFGYLMFGGSHFLTRKFIDTSVGINFGVSYSQGRGVFVGTNERAKMRFKFWTFPLDLSLAVGVPLSRFFKIEGSAGPSVAGIWQNRDDKDEGEGGKDYRQISPGRFVAVKFKISMTDFSDSLFRKFFSQYGISKAYVNLEARNQEYSQFKNDFSISGTSAGIGFSFEYL